MDKSEGKKLLLHYARNSIAPSKAKEVCDAFGVVFNEKLVYTKLRYREMVTDETPRVAVYQLAEYICEQLGIEPDQELLKRANSVMGIGLNCDLTTQAYASMLPVGAK